MSANARSNNEGRTVGKIGREKDRKFSRDLASVTIHKDQDVARGSFGAGETGPTVATTVFADYASTVLDGDGCGRVGAAVVDNRNLIECNGQRGIGRYRPDFIEQSADIGRFVQGRNDDRRRRSHCG